MINEDIVLSRYTEGVSAEGIQTTASLIFDLVNQGHTELIPSGTLTVANQVDLTEWKAQSLSSLKTALKDAKK